MISNSQVVAKLRQLGFRFSDSNKRTDTYRLKGSAQQVTFNRRDDYDDFLVAQILRGAGMTREAAGSWVQSTSTENAERARSETLFPDPKPIILSPNSVIEDSPDKKPPSALPSPQQDTGFAGLGSPEANS